jgi:prepilin-type N-terminal cleavage/methylation domain-containing protein
MITKKSKASQGFTLVEILFALFIGGILVSAIYFVLISGQRSSVGIERKIAAQGDVRAALEIMALEIEMASFNPHFATGIWHPSPAGYTGGGTYCTGTTLNPTYRGIQEATPTSILVEMDTGESGSIGDNGNEVIRYAFDPAAANECITRETNCGGDQPFLGRPGASTTAGPRNVRVINARSAIAINNGAGNPAIFRYYDAKNPATELYPDTDPTAIPRIRRIDITLAVETDELDPSTRSKRQMIYTTSVIPRNHALNF